jgi:hypothetical protein
MLPFFAVLLLDLMLISFCPFLSLWLSGLAAG